MITLTCAKCQTKLEVDDAFGGGVCRCRHCGAIQHVPAVAKKGKSSGKGTPATTATTGTTASGGTSSKKRGGGLSDTSLGTLADVAAMAGMTSDEPAPERLPAPGAYPPPRATTGQRAPMRTSTWLMIGVGVVIAAGVLVWLLSGGRGGGQSANGAATAPPAMATSSADR